MKILKKTLTALILLSVSGLILAHEYKINQLVVDYPIARETPPGTKVGAGYLIITNNGDEDEKLIGVFGDISPIIQIHSMSIENNVMRMQEMKGGLVIPAKQSVRLEAGGNHIMFMNLPQQLKAGEQYDVTLVFEKAGKLEVTFNIEKHNKQDDHAKHMNHKEKHKDKKMHHHGHINEKNHKHKSH